MAERHYILSTIYEVLENGIVNSSSKDPELRGAGLSHKLSEKKEKKINTGVHPLK